MHYYSIGHQSYIQANCELAIESFDRVNKPWRIFDFGGYNTAAISEKNECREFQRAVEEQNSGDQSGAILEYSDFIFNQKKRSIITSSINEDRIDFQPD